MNRWIEIPHGRFLVRIDDPHLWLRMRVSFALEGLWWVELPTISGVDDMEPMTLPEFLLVASTCPCDEHMDELAKDMGVTPFDRVRL